MIKALRIDHRLVHGQVAFSWSHHLGIARIIVIDDKAAADDFQKMALNMAKPAGVKLNVFNVNGALERCQKIDSLKDETFIIFGNALDASRYICGNPVYRELNVGGIPKKENSQQYSDVVYLTPEEKEALQKIQSTGCELFMQQLPTSKREKLIL